MERAAPFAVEFYVGSYVTCLRAIIWTQSQIRPIHGACVNFKRWESLDAFVEDGRAPKYLTLATNIHCGCNLLGENLPLSIQGRFLWSIVGHDFARAWEYSSSSVKESFKRKHGSTASVKRMGLEMYSLSERVLNNCKYVNNGTYADTGTRWAKECE